jgi:hypothetical protein
LIYVVYGTRVHTQFVRNREAFCGRCLKKTMQSVGTLEERSHIYFIEYGGGRDLGTVAHCETCRTVVPLIRRESGEAKPPRAERWTDAFLDAHVLELTRADKSTWIGIAWVGLVVLGMIAFALGWRLASLAGLDNAPVFVALGAAVLGAIVLAYRRVKAQVGDAVFSRAVATRIEKLGTLTGKTPREVGARARHLGYDRLARHFDLPLYQGKVALASAGASRED